MKTFSVQPMVKRLMDATVSTSVLLLSLPLMIGIGLAIYFRMGRPVFFRQQRPGWRGRPFLLYKFRTMTDAQRPDGSPKSCLERITPLGRFLRQTSLDELPQLWNVLRGDLSLVGPRPLLMEYLDLYTSEQARRLDAKPGITGWAQIHGRNSISWEEKFVLDVWYVDHWNLLLDLKILLATVGTVFVGKGVNANLHTTMPGFLGSKERKNRDAA